MQVAPIVERFFSPLLTQEQESDKLEHIRANTILDSKTHYFDWTASGLAYRDIESRIDEILPFYANTHSFSSTHAKIMSALYEEAKVHLAECLELDSSFALLACGSGASGAIKKFQELTGLYIPPQSLEILQKQGFLQTLSVQEKSALARVFISSYEHHSNEISLRQGLCEVLKIALDSQGRFSLQDLQSQLQLSTSSTRLIGAFCLASNVSGLLSPYKEIARIFRQYNNSILAFDAASASSHLNIPSQYFDALFLSPHKLLGGVQACGLLAIKRSLLDSQNPSFSGGGTIEYASNQGHLYVQDMVHRQEAGTPPILGLLRACLSFKLRNEVGLDLIRRREKILSQILLHELKAIPALELYGDWHSAQSQHNLGIISFNIACVSPFDLSLVLSERFGIQTRAGCSCAGPYGHYLMELDSLHIDSQSTKTLYELYQNPSKRPGWIRISLHYAHSLEDIEYLVDSLQKSIKLLRR